MINLAAEVTKKINLILEGRNLDGLIISDIYNIQYATGVKISCAHAQTDLRIFALFLKNSVPIVIVPKCWIDIAIQNNYGAKVISYSLKNDQISSGIEELFKLCLPSKRLGSDSDLLPIKI